jgi:P pilus assembly chaperone PapD
MQKFGVVIIVLLFGVTLKKHADCAHASTAVIYNKITDDRSMRENSLKTAPSFCVCVWILKVSLIGQPGEQKNALSYLHFYV